MSEIYRTNNINLNDLFRRMKHDVVNNERIISSSAILIATPFLNLTKNSKKKGKLESNESSVTALERLSDILETRKQNILSDFFNTFNSFFEKQNVSNPIAVELRAKIREVPHFFAHQDFIVNRSSDGIYIVKKRLLIGFPNRYTDDLESMIIPNIPSVEKIVDLKKYLIWLRNTATFVYADELLSRINASDSPVITVDNLGEILRDIPRINIKTKYRHEDIENLNDYVFKTNIRVERRESVFKHLSEVYETSLRYYIETMPHRIEFEGIIIDANTNDQSTTGMLDAVSEISGSLLSPLNNSNIKKKITS